MSSALVTRAVPNVSIPVEGAEDCPGYLSNEGKDSNIGVIVIQEWWGMNESIQKTADNFGKQGFRALVPDLYRGKVAKDREDAGHLMSGLDWPGALRDIKGAVDYLRQQGAKKVAVVGFCMGGALTLLSSTFPGVDAGSAFYGVPDLSNLDVSKIKIPLIAHFGNNDDHKGFSDPETADKLEKKLKDGGVQVEVYRYPNAGHAFTNRDRPEAFNEEATALALQRTYDFFKKA